MVFVRCYACILSFDFKYDNTAKVIGVTSHKTKLKISVENCKCVYYINILNSFAYMPSQLLDCHGMIS